MTVSDRLTVHAVIICAVALVGGGAVFLGREWKAREVERERLAWLRAESNDGERFAVRHGWSACLPEALRRAELARNWERAVFSQFLPSCLRVAPEPLDGGCAGVPAPGQARGWMDGQCVGSKAPDDRCARVVGALVRHCDEAPALRDAGLLRAR